jgi:hypothetical protein
MDEIYRTALEYIDAYESAEESSIYECCTRDTFGCIEQLRKDCAAERERLAQIYEADRAELTELQAIIAGLLER